MSQKHRSRRRRLTVRRKIVMYSHIQLMVHRVHRIMVQSVQFLLDKTAEPRIGIILQVGFSEHLSQWRQCNRYTAMLERGVLGCVNCPTLATVEAGTQDHAT